MACPFITKMRQGSLDILSLINRKVITNSYKYSRHAKQTSGKEEITCVLHA